MSSPPNPRIILLLVVLLTFAGCNKMRVRVDNPLVGPPPPRDPERVAALARQEANDATPSEPGTSLVSGNQGQLGVVLISQTVEEESPPEGISDLATEVAAVVNGRPIFVGQVVEPFTIQLEQARAELSEEDFRELVTSLVKRDLEPMIDQALLVDSLMSTLKPEQKEQVDAQIDKLFEERIAAMQEQLEAPSLASLEIALQAQGTSLASLRRRFGQVQIAGQAMAMKIGDPPIITRADLLAEYHASIEEFTKPTQIRWQQIWVSRRTNPQQAQQQIQRAAAALEQGMPFDEAVRQFSQGATVSNDGHWDWTRPESLENQDVAQFLRTARAGQISGVIEDGNSYQIVLVTERKEAGVTPFEEVQMQLRERLQAEREEEAAQAVLAELRQSGVVERFFE